MDGSLALTWTGRANTQGFSAVASSHQGTVGTTRCQCRDFLIVYDCLDRDTAPSEEDVYGRMSRIIQGFEGGCDLMSRTSFVYRIMEKYHTLLWNKSKTYRIEPYHDREPDPMTSDGNSTLG
jgi:hypothetical protein